LPELGAAEVSLALPLFVEVEDDAADPAELAEAAVALEMRADRRGATGVVTVALELDGPAAGLEVVGSFLRERRVREVGA